MLDIFYTIIIQEYIRTILLFFHCEMSSTSPAIEIDENDSSSLSSNKRSEVYQYFTFKSPRWYCNYCYKHYADTSTSTLWRHVSKIHPKAVKAQKQKEQEQVGKMDKYTVSDKKENVSGIFN